MWRQCTKVKLNVYENDKLMFQCHTSKDAENIVSMLNDWRVWKEEAERVAIEFIGYPCDETDLKNIENATPLQAIRALEDRIKELVK